ncbi:unnamed protein product [Brassica oleracea var. botrytis]
MDNNNIVVSKNQKLQVSRSREHKWHKWGGIYPPKRD